MTNRIRKTITIQTSTRTIVRATGSQLTGRCHQCGAEVSIITTENAAGALQTTPGEIHGLLESGELHAVEEPSGTSLICGNSLSAASTESEPEAIATGSTSEPSALAGGPTLVEGERQ